MYSRSGRPKIMLETPRKVSAGKKIVAFMQSKKRAKSASDIQYIGGRLTAGIRGPEVKTVDILATAVNVTSATPLLVSLLSAIAQGTTSSSRIGDRIQIKSVYVKANFYNNSTVMTTFNWSLVLDKSPDNTTPGVTSIYSNSTSNLTQLQVANLARFRVLRRQNTPYLTSGTVVGCTIDEFEKLDVGTRFPDATGEAVSYGIYFVVTSQSAVNVAALVDYDIRVRFTDE